MASTTTTKPPEAEATAPDEVARRVRRIPLWAWLAGLVVVSALVRYALARRVVAPWIMGDELIYSELAKSLAEHGEFRIREQPVGLAFSALYPILIAPAYLLFESVPAAYATAKAINGILFSLAAVPTYLLARRVVAARLAMLAAALAVLVPGALYSGMLMTENVFYPLVAGFAFALVLALERPAPLRVLALLGVVALAFVARAQALVFVPVLLTAPLLLVVFDGSGVRGIARFRWLYGLAAAAVAAVLGLQLARGESAIRLLGAYEAVGERAYRLGDVARWALYHLAELDLALGIVPFAALLLLALLARRLDGRSQALVAVAVALTAWMVVQVGAFASQFSLRIEERNLFHVAPLLFVALVVWLERGLPRPPLRAAAAAGVAALLPLAIPFDRLLGPGNVSATSDTFGLLLWWDVWELGVAPERLWIPAVAMSAVLAAVFGAVPRRAALLVPALLVAFLLVSTYSAEHRIRSAAVGALFQGITHEQRDWIDRAVGADAEVAALWSSGRDWLTVVQNEFFSRSVGPVYTLDAPMPVALPQTPLELDAESGRLLAPDDEPVEAQYALVDDSVPLAGAVVARDESKGLRVVQPERPLRLEHATSGIYPDRWTGPVFAYRRYGCEGGRVRVLLEQDPNLVREPQRVVARAADGSLLARGTVRHGGRQPSLLVPLRPDGAGACVVRFAVAPTAVPRGPGDDRRLGIRVLGFEYTAP